jgi:hypothetical protein
MLREGRMVWERRMDRQQKGREGWKDNIKGEKDG